ncbi:MAG: TlpA family protein disulfide reductase [Candidatus Roizmanbacteria bacterium]|nr:TlpA family protein disulfide reductase [Candidatus Roizmanbacteria bacterium]
MKNKVIITIIVVALAGVGLYFAAGNKDSSQTQASIGTSVGDKAPAFSYTTLDGAKVESASLRGKVVVITSSAAWCPTCIMEAQQFAPVYQKHKDDSVAFITVDIDPRDSKDFIEQFKKDNNTPWDYADAQGGADISQKFGFDRFEVTYIIDKDGVIQFKDSVITSSDKLDAEIQKL